MKLARNTRTKIVLIVVLCLLTCVVIGGLSTNNRVFSRGGVLSWPWTGGLFGCAAAVPAAYVLDEAIDGDVPEAPDAPDVPDVPDAPSIGGDGNGGAEAWGRGSFEVEASRVSAIELSWLAGEVNVRVVPDEETGGAIRVTETIEGRSEELQWDLSGSTLSINYMDNYAGLSGCSPGWYGNKLLEMLIPASLGESLRHFEIEAASGEYAIDGAGADLLCQELELGVASGSVSVSDATVEKFTMSLASGRVSFGGTITQALAIDQASGDFTLGQCAAPPQTITGSLASGRIVLELPVDTALEANVDKTSGNFVNDFADSAGDADHSCSLDLDMLSGSLEVVAVPQ